MSDPEVARTHRAIEARLSPADKHGSPLHVGDKLVSNDGKGPLIATVERIGERDVALSRPAWRSSQHSWTLPRVFLSSRSCGWIKEVTRA